MLTFGAEQRGGALQELPNLLQLSLFSALDAAWGVITTCWGRYLITDSEP